MSKLLHQNCINNPLFRHSNLLIAALDAGFKPAFPFNVSTTCLAFELHSCGRPNSFCKLSNSLLTLSTQACRIRIWERIDCQLCSSWPGETYAHSSFCSPAFWKITANPLNGVLSGSHVASWFLWDTDCCSGKSIPRYFLRISYWCAVCFIIFPPAYEDCGLNQAVRDFFGQLRLSIFSIDFQA